MRFGCNVIVCVLKPTQASKRESKTHQSQIDEAITLKDNRK